MEIKKPNRNISRNLPEKIKSTRENQNRFNTNSQNIFPQYDPYDDNFFEQFDNDRSFSNQNNDRLTFQNTFQIQSNNPNNIIINSKKNFITLKEINHNLNSYTLNTKSTKNSIAKKNYHCCSKEKAFSKNSHNSYANKNFITSSKFKNILKEYFKDIDYVDLRNSHQNLNGNIKQKKEKNEDLNNNIEGFKYKKKLPLRNETSTRSVKKNNEPHQIKKSPTQTQNLYLNYLNNKLSTINKGVYVNKKKQVLSQEHSYKNIKNIKSGNNQILKRNTTNKYILNKKNQNIYTPKKIAITRGMSKDNKYVSDNINLIPSIENKKSSNNNFNYKNNYNNINSNNFDDEEFFKDQDEISSIKLNSSYESYTNNNTNYFINADDDEEKITPNNIIYHHKFNPKQIIVCKKIEKKNTVTYSKKKNNINNINTNKSNGFDGSLNEISNRNQINNIKNEEKEENSIHSSANKPISKIDNELNNLKKINFYSTTQGFFLKNGGLARSLNGGVMQKLLYTNKSKNLFASINSNNTCNIAELVIIGDKFKELLGSLENGKSCVYNYCFDFWNHFKICEILNKLEFFVKNKEDLNIMNGAINYLLLSVTLAFDCSYKQSVLNKIKLILKEMLIFDFKNLIIILEYLLENTSLSKSPKTFWGIKLRKLITDAKNKLFVDDECVAFENNNINSFNSLKDNKDSSNSKLKNGIKDNMNFIFQTIRITLMNYKNKNTNILSIFFKEINKQYLSCQEIYEFFSKKILHSNGLFSYLSPKLYIKQNKNFSPIKPPYITSKNKHKYTLVLGLEDTLVSFKFGGGPNQEEGVVRLRPGVKLFFNEIKKYYEIIIFSLFDENIGNILVDVLECKNKFVEMRLFVQHSIIYENQFVKDLSRIGRPLDKIIIVDNVPQNYKLNKKNAINITSYWEDDYSDSALNELIPILTAIANDGGDVRDGIKKYKDDILSKVSSKIN